MSGKRRMFLFAAAVIALGLSVVSCGTSGDGTAALGSAQPATPTPPLNPAATRTPTPPLNPTSTPSGGQSREVIVQTGTLYPAPQEPPLEPWETEYSRKTGVTLFATYDSSGPAVWNPAEHPLVFITTVGPGYGGLLSGVTWCGVAIIDANTHELVNYTAYDMSGEGWKGSDVFECHGLAVSPDGRWIYLPTGNGSKGRFLIINAETMKLDKQLAMRPGGRPHHGKAFIDTDGNPRVLLYGWAQPPFVLDPNDDNRVVGGVDFNDMSMEGYLYFVTPDGSEMWATGRWRNGIARSEIHGNIVMTVDTKTWKLKDTIPFPDESTPVWVDFSADGHFAYVSGGHSSSVMQYDRQKKERVGIARAGVEGPYGVRLSWDGKELYTVGKGEGSTNRGQELGLLNTENMAQRGTATTVFVTGCVRGDHATIHPDPAANEIWISCNSSFEMVVFNMGTKQVTDRIPMPSGGSTHSGAFVSYENGFPGEVLSDQNGLHGEALEEQRVLQGGSTLPTPTPTQPSAGRCDKNDLALVNAGRDIFFKGNQGLGCAACHGPLGKGELGVGPYILGKPRDAIVTALHTVVQMSVLRLSETEIDQVCSYLAFRRTEDTQ